MRVTSQPGQLKLKRCILEAMMICTGLNGDLYWSDRWEKWYLNVGVEDWWLLWDSNRQRMNSIWLSTQGYFNGKQSPFSIYIWWYQHPSNVLPTGIATSKSELNHQGDVERGFRRFYNKRPTRD
jgi:hypothetical protein